MSSLTDAHGAQMNGKQKASFERFGLLMQKALSGGFFSGSDVSSLFIKELTGFPREEVPGSGDFEKR